LCRGGALASTERRARSGGAERNHQEGVAADRQAEFFAFAERTGSHRPSEPYWWLPFIGVDPLHRHKGFGSALLRHALVRCDRDHMPAHLETGNPANVPLYERHGFKSPGSFQVSAAGASWFSHSMARPYRLRRRRSTAH
jgi:GNAT superfamily N-acetyltransferase